LVAWHDLLKKISGSEKCLPNDRRLVADGVDYAGFMLRIVGKRFDV